MMMWRTDGNAALMPQACSDEELALERSRNRMHEQMRILAPYTDHGVRKGICPACFVIIPRGRRCPECSLLLVGSSWNDDEIGR